MNKFFYTTITKKKIYFLVYVYSQKLSNKSYNIYKSYTDSNRKFKGWECRLHVWNLIKIPPFLLSFFVSKIKWWNFISHDWNGWKKMCCSFILQRGTTYWIIFCWHFQHEFLISWTRIRSMYAWAFFFFLDTVLMNLEYGTQEYKKIKNK